MDEKETVQSQSLIQFTREQLVKIEMEVKGITVEQQRLSSVIGDQGKLLSEITARTIMSEEAIKVLIDANKTHNEHMETMQTNQVDTGQILVAMQEQLKLIKWTGGTIAFFLISYVLTHFLK